MIATQETIGPDFKPKKLDAQFQVSSFGPRFVPTSTVRFTQRADNVVSEWADESRNETDASTWRAVLGDVLARSERDIAKNPNSARAHMNYALALLNTSRPDDAIKELRAALAIDGKHYAAAMLLARLLIQQGDFDQASKLYSDVRESYPKDPVPVIGLAHIAMRRDNFDAARELLSKVVALDPNNVYPRYALGLLLLQLDRYREAIGHLKAAVRLNLKSANLHQALGVAYALTRDFPRAVRSFRAAFALAPRAVSAATNLARALSAQKEFTEAIDVLKTYLRDESSDKTARELLAQTHGAMNQHQAERTQLTHIVASLTGDSGEQVREKCRLLNNIAVSFTRERNWKEAEKILNEALALANANSVKTYPNLYQNLARAFLVHEDFSRARRLLDQCEQLFPNDPDTRLLMGSILGQQGDYDNAIRELEAVIGGKPAKSAGYAALGCLLADGKRDYAKAVRILEEGLGRFGADPALINNLAYGQLMLGQAKEARATLELLPKHAEIEPHSRVTLTATRGLLRLWEGDFGTAVSLYRRAADMASASGEKKLARAVKQKMHLELARAYLRRGGHDSAVKELRLGLQIKDANRLYQKDLLELSAQLADSSSKGVLDQS